MAKLLICLILLFQSSWALPQGWTPQFKKVASHIAECNVDALNEWLNAGGSLESSDSNGYRLIHLAVLDKSNLVCLKWLLDKGVDVNVQANNGSTPLLNAALSFNDEAVDLLYKAGANPYIEDQVGNNIFYIALLMAQSDEGSENQEVMNRIISLSQDMYMKEREKKIDK
jgi:ankyrin repeat protein